MKGLRELADRVDNRFIAMARAVANFVGGGGRGTGRQQVRTVSVKGKANGNDRSEVAAHAGGRRWRETANGMPAAGKAGDSDLRAEVATVLNRVDHILSQAEASMRAVGEAGRSVAAAAPSDDSRARSLRGLFHEDATRRLDAVARLRRHGARDARAVLEGALMIEEEEHVRTEIRRALGDMH